MLRTAGLLLVALAAGCARIEFSPDGAGGAGGAGNGGGGLSGDGGSGANGGEPQGGSPGPCPDVPEECNGIDDDCDGVADEPDTFPATDVCDGCDWISFEGRPYASCPTVGPPEAVNCPAGMRIVVLQSMAEHDALLDLVLVESHDGYVGMRQADGSPERDTGWQWFREGMPPPWFGTGAQEPDDYTPGAYEPVGFENDSENCAGLYNYKDAGNTRGFVDSDCVDAFERVLCEPIADECIPGAACMLEAGCTGSFDCSRAVGNQCVAAPADEICDGKDNDCNGEIDEGACGCVELTDPSTMRQYKHCSAPFTPDSARCGAGFRLAMLESADEATWAASELAPGDVLFVGMYQRTTATMPDGDWLFLDAAPAVTASWATAQPNDDDGMEDGIQNCGSLHPDGAYDSECNAAFPYLCEEL